MSDYRPTIGLEIHAELKTQTKMFCACLNDPNEKRPNTNLCPVCMAHPGSLPVINKEAVRKVLLVGSALSGELANFTEFDRKNYFYPDIPKGYQISQYAYPLVRGGSLNTVAITRVHLEEDTARSQHTGEHSLVDFNRAGVPLMELVTEPVIRSAGEASAFARELQLLLRALGAGDAHMEKGEMRVEANISVSRNDTLGTKVEVKNLNSFKSVERAIAHEIERQTALLEQGGEVVQETRGWDEVKQTTFSQRKKESSHDYRYFPDPDLPKLLISEIPEFSSEILKAQLPELPWEKRSRYVEDYGIKPEHADFFVQDEFYGAMFEGVAKYAPNTDLVLIGLAGNYIASDIVGMLQNSALQSKVAYLNTEEFYSAFFKLMQMIKSNTISSRGAKDILLQMYTNGGDPETIAKEKGLVQQNDTQVLATVVIKVIEAYPQVAADYKAGKEAALQFLVGQGIKETRGAGNPAVLREEFKKAL